MDCTRLINLDDAHRELDDAHLVWLYRHVMIATAMSTVTATATGVVLYRPAPREGDQLRLGE